MITLDGSDGLIVMGLSLDYLMLRVVITYVDDYNVAVEIPVTDAKDTATIIGLIRHFRGHHGMAKNVTITTILPEGLGR